eukprot:249884_1
MSYQSCCAYMDHSIQQNHQNNQSIQSKYFDHSSQTQAHNSTCTYQIPSDTSQCNICNSIETNQSLYIQENQSLQEVYICQLYITKTEKKHRTQSLYPTRSTPSYLCETTTNNIQHMDNNITILPDTITIETLLNKLKKGITNAQNALHIAKMVSTLINKESNNRQIIK